MNKTRRGFTIVELLVVIVVIGLLATIVTVAYNGISQRAKDNILLSDKSSVNRQLEAFYALNGKYPSANNCPTTGTTDICLKTSSDNTVTYTPLPNATTATTYSLAWSSSAVSAPAATIRSSAAGSLAAHQTNDILLAFACNSNTTIPSFSADWTVIASRSSGYSGALAYKIATSASTAMGTITNYQFYNTVSVSGGLRTNTTGISPSFSAGTATGVNNGNVIDIPTIGSTTSSQLQIAHGCGTGNGQNPWLIGVALSAGLTQLQSQGWTWGQDILVSSQGTSPQTITSTNYGIAAAVMLTIKLTP